MSSHVAMVELYKANPGKFLESTERLRDARTKSLAVAVNRWLLRFGRLAAEAEVKRIATERRRIEKVKSKDRGALEQELLDLLVRFGVRTVNDSGRNAARLLDAEGKWEMSPELLADFISEHRPRVQNLVEETEAAVKESLRVIISDALKEDVRPSNRDIARRIARQWHGPAAGRDSLFSFERATVIARTEVGIATSEGIQQGFEAVGIERIGWRAFPDDGRSGDREHWKMNRHKPITLAASRGRNRSKWFKLPDGARMPYPQWVGGPARHIINCRCAPRPVR